MKIRRAIHYTRQQHKEFIICCMLGVIDNLIGLLSLGYLVGEFEPWYLFDYTQRED